MELNQVIISVIIPAIVSGGFGLYILRRQKRLEFSYNYKSYILEKRKKAYDEVEQIINQMRSLTLAFRNQTQTQDHWAIVVERIFHNSLLSWVTKELQEKLVAISDPFLDTMNARRNDTKPSEHFVQMLFDLEKIYFNDLVSLDNIDAFINQKRICELLPFTKAAGGNIHTTE